MIKTPFRSKHANFLPRTFSITRFGKKLVFLKIHFIPVIFFIFPEWTNRIFKYSRSHIQRFPWQFCCIWPIYLDSYNAHSFLRRRGPVYQRLNIDHAPSPPNHAFVLLIQLIFKQQNYTNGKWTKRDNAPSHAKHVSYRHAVTGIMYKLSIRRLHQQMVHSTDVFYLFIYLFIKQIDLQNDPRGLHWFIVPEGFN